MAMATLLLLLLCWGILPSPTPAAPLFPSLSALWRRDSDVESIIIPLPPSIDPWYRAPPGWQTKQPGEILKIRLAPNLRFFIGNSLEVYQILYRTTDSQYNPSWAVTTLFIPLLQYRCQAATPYLCAHAVLSYQLPYDTCNVDASPSYGLHLGEPYGDIAIALSRGWFVSVPDYEGPLASFTAGVQAGHATIDSVRAVFAVAGRFGLRMSLAKVALWGYSGGALAAEWAAELRVQYAPKMHINGIALGGLCPNITSVRQAINEKSGAGLVPSGLIGMTSQYPELSQFMQSRLHPKGPFNSSTFLAARTMTGLQAVDVFAYQDIYRYFVNGIDDLQTKAMRDMFDQEGMMGFHGVPEMPVFAYKAIGDEVSPVEDTDELVNRYCQVEANILYHRNTVGDHNDELVNGRERAFRWLISVLEGDYDKLYATKGCTIQNVTVDMSASNTTEA